MTRNRGPEAATRVGVDTASQRTGVRKGSGSNIPATRYWHQGFGVIKQEGFQVVPFTSRATAARIAEQATANTKIPMSVVPVYGVGWGYRP
jgi:hypothetical protein